MNIFEFASKNKVRFNFMGSIYTEDLWDLSLENLDDIYKKLNAKVKQSDEESLLGKKSVEDNELEVKIEIVKHIVAFKLEEREKAINAKNNKLQKEKIKEIMKRKQDASLEGLTEAELEELYNKL